MRKTAQQMAKSNYDGYYKDFLKGYYSFQSLIDFPCKMSFAHPKSNVGYGKLLIAIATLPKASRTSMRKINAAISNPTTPNWGFDTVRRLKAANLIFKGDDDCWSLTSLGRRYVKEMHLI